MTTIEKPKFANKIVTSFGVITSGAATLGASANCVTVYPATTYGGQIQSVIVSTNDTTSGNLFIAISRAGNVIPLGIVAIPAASGNAAATPAIDAIGGKGTFIQGLPLDSYGRPYIAISPGDSLIAGLLAAPTASKSFFVATQGVEFSVDPTV